VQIGQSVMSVIDSAEGRVIDADYTAVKIQWNDGLVSIYSRQNIKRFIRALNGDQGTLNGC
jgi:hypothetical protein